ncbi:MAG: hypothetical protein V3R20_01250, partial [Sphingomonadales bacterium]
ASDVAFSDGFSLSEIFRIFSGSVDTAFWLLLVVLLELETYVIEDHILKKPWVKYSMMGARGLCYTMIVYVLYGYIVKTGFQSDYALLTIASACDLVSQNFSIILAMEDYIPLTAENCGTLGSGEIYKLAEADIIGPLENIKYAKNQAWIDIINASTWIFVVILLEVDVWYQLKGDYKGPLFKASKYIKIVLYTILFGCAIAWGYTGIFLDFSDAFIWLFAFFFIEMNLFQWQQETEQKAAAA